MRRCVLCGIPITRWLHEPWLKEFRAVWIEDDKWDDVRLSGVGICDEYDDVITGSVPIDQCKRYDDPLDPDSVIEVALVSLSLEHIVSPETLSYGSEPYWGYGLHSSCWDIFSIGFIPDLRLLFQACLSMPIGRDMLMDWGHEYGGAAVLSRTCEIPTMSCRFTDLSLITDNFRSDPFKIPILSRAIKFSLRLESDAFRSHLNLDNLKVERDKFHKLPLELLQLVAILLPSNDARSLRLASPVFAILQLTEKFWESRFQQGNEFDHIFEVTETPPQSWLSLYLSLQVWARDNPNMANRRRVWALSKGLQDTLRQMEHVGCHGIPSKTWLEPSVSSGGEEYEEKSYWCTPAAHGITHPTRRFINGCRMLRTRTLHFSQPLEIQYMSVSFVHTGGGEFVSGFLFVDGGGQSHALGYLHPNQSVTIRASGSQRIQGWELALDKSGMRAISLILDDGTRSEWAGEPGRSSRWLLAGAEGISAVKAEFDALKLISLSRNRTCDSSGSSQWRNNCLWYPDIPPAQMMFNGSWGDQPSGRFNLPLTTLFFGGADGRRLSSVVEIVIWTFDECHVAGVQFNYADASQTECLGQIGPFSDDHPAAQKYDWFEGRRIPMSIDGPGGEVLQRIEVQEHGSYVVGLKIRTNFGREVTSPQCPFETDEDWVVVEPTGSTVVGLFGTCVSPFLGG